MDASTQAHTVEFIKTHLHENGVVYFFATEPLMSWEVLVVLHSQIAAERSDLTFGLTTNGTELNPEIAEYLAFHRFGVLISMDGNSVTHNMVRGRYSDTFVGYQFLKEAGINPAIACCVIPEYLPHLKKMVQHMYYLNPEVIALNKVTAGWKTPWDWRALRQALYETYRWIIRKDPEVLKFFWEYLHHYLELQHTNQDCFAAKDCYTCGAAQGALGIDYQGVLYPCQAMNAFNYPIGDIYQGVDEEKLTYLQSINYPECKYCHVPGCGGCYKTNYLNNNNIIQLDDASCRWECIRWETTKRVFDEAPPYLQKEVKNAVNFQNSRRRNSVTD